MKSYRFLFQEIIDEENIKFAISEACKGRKGKRKKQKLMEIYHDPNNVERIRNKIINYKTVKREAKEINDGISKKKRKIYVPSAEEIVIQHAVVQVLDKYLSKGIYEHAYAAIKGKGQVRAEKRIQKWIRTDFDNCKYFLKMDIKKYFPSIPQKLVIQKLKYQIKDSKTIELVEKILAAAEDGIPLGYYISQWLANWYLIELDHYIKEDLKAKYYIRWMDDMVIFSPDKKDLYEIKNNVSNFLYLLGLQLKNDWRVNLFSDDEDRKRKRSGKGTFLDFMGFRFYRNRVTIRESIFYKMCRKAKKIGQKMRVTAYDAKQFIAYLGWLKYTNTYYAYCRYIKPYINIKYLRNKISKYDRRKAHEFKMAERILSINPRRVGLRIQSYCCLYP